MPFNPVLGVSFYLVAYCKGIVKKGFYQRLQFYPEKILFWFYAETKEGLEFRKIQAKFRQQYEKYIELYSDMPSVVALIKKRFAVLNEA